MNKRTMMNMDGYGQNIRNVLSNLMPQRRNENSDIQFDPLSDLEIDQLFRDDAMIQKIICKYPLAGKSLGYTLENEKGEVVSEDDVFVLEAFCEASIMARKYGKCYLIISDKSNDQMELKKGSELISFVCRYDIQLEGDFYIYDDKKIHKSKVFIFLGNRTYLKDVNVNDHNYSDSVIQSIKKAFFNFIGSNEICIYILSNLSYLTVGIEGLAGKSATDDGKKNIIDRLLSINQNRQLTRLLAHDLLKEKIGFTSQSTSGVSDLNEDIKNVLVVYTDYPKEQLFEDSPRASLGTGMSNQLIARMLWAVRLQNWVEQNWMKNYDRLFQTISLEKVVVKIPFEVHMTELEKADIQEKGANRIATLKGVGVINEIEARTGYLTDEYTLNIVLDENFEPPKEEVVTPESKTKDNSQTQQKKSVKTNTDSNTDALPSDEFWEAMSDVSMGDVSKVAKGVLT